VNPLVYSQAFLLTPLEALVRLGTRDHTVSIDTRPLLEPSTARLPPCFLQSIQARWLHYDAGQLNSAFAWNVIPVATSIVEEQYTVNILARPHAHSRVPSNIQRQRNARSPDARSAVSIGPCGHSDTIFRFEIGGKDVPVRVTPVDY
jgi:hypothetical protein